MKIFLGLFCLVINFGMLNLLNNSIFEVFLLVLFLILFGILDLFYNNLIVFYFIVENILFGNGVESWCYSVIEG